MLNRSHCSWVSHLIAPDIAGFLPSCRLERLFDYSIIDRPKPVDEPAAKQFPFLPCLLSFWVGIVSLFIQNTIFGWGM